jgi:hypothetical protein
MGKKIILFTKLIYFKFFHIIKIFFILINLKMFAFALILLKFYYNT